MNTHRLEIATIVDADSSATRFAEDDFPWLERMFENVHGRAILFDTDWIIRLCNQETLDFLNVPRERVVGARVHDVMGEWIAAAYEPLLERVRATGSVKWDGWIDFGALGRRYIQEMLLTYRAEKNGEITGIIALSKDITDIKLFEETIASRRKREEKTEALHKAVVASSLDAIVIVDGCGNVVDFNPAAARLFGYRAADVLGNPVSAILPLPSCCAPQGSDRQKDAGARMELMAKTKSGDDIPVDVSITDTMVDGTRYCTAHIRDLREARAAALQIERQKNALFQNEKLAALGALLSGVAHELNNPLAIVLGQSLMLREKLDLQQEGPEKLPDLRKRAQKIEEAANRCARIVKTFLAMARQGRTERRSVNLAALIDEVLELLSYNLTTNGIVVEREIEADLPPVCADRDLLHQVIMNLLLNAREALEETTERQRTIRISATSVPGRREIVVSVRDNGPGIPAAIRNRIFDPFFTTKAQDQGTGIGLSVSRGLIENHGGSLELADADQNFGAEFVMKIPLGENPARTEAAPDSEPQPAADATEGQFVLIVDDEPDLTQILKEIVRSKGHRTLVAHSGRQAQALISQHGNEIGAILCDIRMPDGDGPDLFQWITRSRPALLNRIGFMTGDTLGPAAGRFLASHDCPVIEKPFSKADVQMILARLCGQTTDMR